MRWYLDVTYPGYSKSIEERIYEAARFKPDTVQGCARFAGSTTLIGWESKQKDCLETIEARIRAAGIPDVTTSLYTPI